MEYMARLPPIRKEFQLVTIPQRPPMISTFAMTLLLKARAIASAVTRPEPESVEAASCSGDITRPTARMMSA